MNCTVVHFRREVSRNKLVVKVLYLPLVRDNTCSQFRRFVNRWGAEYTIWKLKV